MAHTRKQGGKELLWVLGIPTVIAGGLFYWFINDIDSQFTATPSYTAPATKVATLDTTTPQANTATTPVIQPTPKTSVDAPAKPAPTVTTATTTLTSSASAPVTLTETSAPIIPAVTVTPTPAAPPEPTQAQAQEQEQTMAVATPSPEPGSEQVVAPVINEPVATDTETTTVEQVAIGAAGPNDTPAEDTEYTTQTTAPQPPVVATPSIKPTKTGWIYIGQYRQGQWKSSGFDILDQMPKIGEQYNLTWGANIRARPPAKRTTAGESPQLAENVGYLAIGKQVEVLNVRRSGNKGHIWVEIPR